MRCYFTSPAFLASVSYTSNLHIFTTNTSASSSKTCKYNLYSISQHFELTINLHVQCLKSVSIHNIFLNTTVQFGATKHHFATGTGWYCCFYGRQVTGTVNTRSHILSSPCHINISGILY